MFDIIARAYPRTIEALRRARGMSRNEAAQLLLAAKYGTRAAAWSSADCRRARAMISAAFAARGRRLRFGLEG